MSKLDFSNKVAIVTASCDGIGLQIALALAKNKARVYLAARNPEKTQAIINKYPELDLHYVHFDALNLDSVKSFVNKVNEIEGKIDILVNNFGPNLYDEDLDIENTDYDFFKKIVDSNMQTVYIATQEVIKVMKNQNTGSIVNISAITSKIPDLMWTAYNSAKAMVNILTTNTATQVGKYGIRCNAILPGVVYSDDILEWADQEFLNIVLSHTPLNRLVDREDVANTTMFLASDLAKGITGQLIELASGYGQATPLYSILNSKQ